MKIRGRTFCLLYVDDLDEDEEVLAPCCVWEAGALGPGGGMGTEGSAAGDLFWLER